MNFNNLYEMWRDAWSRNALPPEWSLAGTFTDWAAANNYKHEYGYKGEFTPENLLKAIPVKKTIEKKAEKPAEKGEKHGQNRKTKIG